MKRFRQIVVVLSVLLLTCALLVACKDTPADTSENTDSTTTVPTTTTPLPADTSTTPDTPPVTNSPVQLSPPDQYIEDGNGEWVEQHEEITIGPRDGTDGKKYDWCFRFSFRSEGNHFLNDPDTNEPGLAFTSPDCIFIGKQNASGDVDSYVKYNITYWETKDWYQIFCVADGFVPEDGVSYDIYLFFRTDDNPDHSNYPDSLLYMWNLGNPFTYKAPAEVKSEYGDIEDYIPDIARRTQLIYHDAFEVDAENKLKFTFKSDGDPFTNGGDLPGVSFTLFDSLYINGEEVQIVADSYTTEEWYIIYFTIADYEFVSGEEYEFVFSINSNDPTGTYCSNPNGYFVFYNYTHP